MPCALNAALADNGLMYFTLQQSASTFAHWIYYIAPINIKHSHSELLLQWINLGVVQLRQHTSTQVHFTALTSWKPRVNHALRIICSTWNLKVLWTDIYSADRRKINTKLMNKKVFSSLGIVLNLNFLPESKVAKGTHKMKPNMRSP